MYPKPNNYLNYPYYHNHNPNTNHNHNPNHNPNANPNVNTNANPNTNPNSNPKPPVLSDEFKNTSNQITNSGNMEVKPEFRTETTGQDKMTNLSQPSLSDPHLIKQYLIKWFKIDDDIQNLTLQLKGLKGEKDNLTKQLEGFMEQYNVGDIQANGHQLKYCKTKTKKSHTKKSLQQALQNFFHDENNASNAYTHIMEARVTTEKTGLKRVKVKSPKKK